MRKILIPFFLLAFCMLVLNGCKGKLFGYDNNVTVPLEKKCTVASIYDSTQKQTFVFSYDKNKRPLKAVSTTSTEIHTFEYDGRGRWSKYLMENTDSVDLVYEFIYNDTTDRIKVVNQYRSGGWYSSGFYLNSYLEYFYDSLGRATKINRYVNGEGWYLQDIYRIEYDKNGNISKQYRKGGYVEDIEYVQIEYTAYDDKINFASLNHNFQLLDPFGINNIELSYWLGEAFVPNFSKNNFTKANYYSYDGLKKPDNVFAYKYEYDANGLPSKISGMRVYDDNEYKAVYNYSKILQFNCGN